MSTFKPMLAATVDDVSALRFPLLASPKLDGIRCVIRDVRVLSRSLKPIPNDYVRDRLLAIKDTVKNFDGELVLAGRNAPFHEVSSAIMRRDGEPAFTYSVFDLVADRPFRERFAALRSAVDVARSRGGFVRLVPHVTVTGPAHLKLVEARWLKEGYEGVMLRDPLGPYKHGRSTLKEGYLLKLKRFTDAEAVIVGFEEQEQNCNKAKPDELGRQKRSTHKAGKFGKDTLGAFIVEPHPYTSLNQAAYGTPEKRFRIGTGVGLTIELRQRIWDDRASYLGKVVKYKYQEVGTKDAPRIPVWLGFRDERDT